MVLQVFFPNIQLALSLSCPIVLFSTCACTHTHTQCQYLCQRRPGWPDTGGSPLWHTVTVPPWGRSGLLSAGDRNKRCRWSSAGGTQRTLRASPALQARWPQRSPHNALQTDWRDGKQGESGGVTIGGNRENCERLVNKSEWCFCLADWSWSKAGTLEDPSHLSKKGLHEKKHMLGWLGECCWVELSLKTTARLTSPLSPSSPCPGHSDTYP